MPSQRLTPSRNSRTAPASRDNASSSVLPAPRLQHLLLAFDLALAQFARDPSDVRAVHQIRVCSRRAAAAIHALKHALPSRSHIRLLRALRRFRRLAGPVRDADIALADSAHHTPSRINRMRIERAHHAAALLHVARGSSLAPLLPSAVHATLDDSPAAATRAVANALDRVLRLRSPRSLKHLHALRRRLRRLRFTIEFFLPDLPPSAPRSLKRIKLLLNRLGSLCDAAILLKHARGHHARHAATATLHTRKADAFLAWRAFKRNGAIDSLNRLAHPPEKPLKPRALH